MSVNIHFLVVDDSTMFRRIIISLLKELGYDTVSEAENGDQALRLLQSQDATSPINFVIVDWNMPVMDGLTLVRCIRAALKLNHLQILMVTAATIPGEILVAATAGADGYIRKPFNEETLKEQIDRILSKRGLAKDGVKIEK